MSEKIPGPSRGGDLDPGIAREIDSIASSLTYEDLELDTPPADLWDRISESLRAETAPTELRPVPPANPDGLAETETTATVTDIGSTSSSRRSARNPRLWLLSAAAGLVLIAGLAVGFFASGSENGEVVAATDLEPLADGYLGEAVLASADGEFTLELNLDGLPALPESDGYYEVWLIKSLETGEMQSLGFVDGSQNVPLPAGLDPAEYSTVDLSIEPLDGVPTHSGQSVLRGTLAPAV